jgi:hypothetical protein
MVRGRSGPSSRGSALAMAMATAPPYGGGADTGCLGLLREITSAHVARDRGRQDHDRGKTQNIRSEGELVS